ncbi:ABC transporter A family member 4-like [Zerene cesonia]|uniref:ABC transporter A family member 4-like n=1 Tax=Zerene cesonia TaxID=33412 RepID=UPI0018E59A05|nr:ABC transporter A family member 4-like [Zerene cesonia]
MTVEEKRPLHSRFQRHCGTLFWKSYLQRHRRWRILVMETLFALCLYCVSVYIAKPVFMTPIKAIPEPPLTSADIIASLNTQNILGYAPNIPPYTYIMNKAAGRLGVDTMSASTEDDLNNMLYNRSQGTPISNPIIWVIWKLEVNRMWRFSIRSTERARYATRSENTVSHNPHLRSGFLAVQLAVSEALLEYVSVTPPSYELSLVSMPVSPLMQENRVRQAISGILLCFTLAMLPPVLETQALVVKETINRFKRALRLRNVDYSSMYLGWLVYAYLTVLPVCLLGSTCLLLIFRWIHLLYSFIILLAYVSVMIMLALIMSMFHDTAWVAIVWTTLFTLMQTFVAELIIHHQIDSAHPALTFLLHVIIPPLGLQHAMNEFALLQTGQECHAEGQSMIFTTFFWLFMIAAYFSVLMLLQRTVKQIAIGGEVSWKSVLFKKIEDINMLHRIENPTGRERDKLQEVDELVAKAISMRNVSKSIMDRPVLNNITLDIYRGEFTILHAELIQVKMMTTFEDLITGLTLPDKGSINILGEELRPGLNLMSMQTMMGYCHRSEFLIDDLTVEEHFILFVSLCLWNETSQYVSEYGHLRSKYLLKECNLEGVKREYIRNLDGYYKGQLCWAIAMLLEPRIIIIPHFTGNPHYTAVIKDKIMQYRKYITLIKVSYASVYMEYADRVFIFDNRSLVFGGTPAFMFFKYGREYRLRITFRNNRYTEGKDELLDKASEVGATVRAHLGTLLILRVPTRPTAKVADFVKTMNDNASKYGILSISISIADSEEVLSALIAGVFIGLSLSQVLTDIEHDRVAKKILHGEILTVEALEQKTTLVLQSDNSSAAQSIANAYVLSETNATEKEIENMAYTALQHTESITEYLVTRAIDSPQHYVYMFAYGMEVSSINDIISIKVLYSPIHYDHGAAARSLARVYMALIRHYTVSLDATIQVTDDPLALDLTPWVKYAEHPPIFIQFLLILTISHMILIPSLESGFIRHTQCYTINFSPLRYWFSMFICDLILYWMLVAVMSGAIVGIMTLVAPFYFGVSDIAIITVILAVYGFGCIPQAYLFSLGPRAALNSMIFIMVNIVFGETTVLAKLFYGNALDYALNFLSFSPQFNMAYALIKIKKIFLYNSECNIFKRRNLCSSKTLHKCCPKCGVLQQCFSKQYYLLNAPGVRMEIFAMFSIAIIFATILLTWEYKYIQRFCSYVICKWIYIDKKETSVETLGVIQEKADVVNKTIEMRSKTSIKRDTFGEYLLASNMSQRHYGKYVIRHINFGIGRGEVLALSGLLHHGRLKLCELLAGLKLPNEGRLWSMSKWSLDRNPYQYSRQISLSCRHNPVPHWMTVYDALALIAVLRGVPRSDVRKEISNYIDALELHNFTYKLIQYLEPNEQTRIHFAAAVIGSPPVIILDECTAYQKYSVQRAMYSIIHNLRKRGHAIFISSSSVESHMPVTNRLAIFVNGRIYDIDYVDNLVTRYSDKGYTVVVHLKNDIDIERMFSNYFKTFVINDVTEVLANVQVLDADLTWATIFEKMEKLQAENHNVYSYVVSSVPIDYIYNSILSSESGQVDDVEPKSIFTKYLCQSKPKKRPNKHALAKLRPFEKKYSITKLKELPWSVIFHR